MIRPIYSFHTVSFNPIRYDREKNNGSKGTWIIKYAWAGVNQVPAPISSSWWLLEKNTLLCSLDLPEKILLHLPWCYHSKNIVNLAICSLNLQHPLVCRDQFHGYILFFFFLRHPVQAPTNHRTTNCIISLFNLIWLWHNAHS